MFLEEKPTNPVLVIEVVGNVTIELVEPAIKCKVKCQ